MLLIIPLPLFFAQTVYGVRGLEAWVVIGMIWTFTSAFTVVLYPLWESRAALTLIARGMIKVSSTRAKNHWASFDQNFLGHILWREWTIYCSNRKAL